MAEHQSTASAGNSLSAQINGERVVSAPGICGGDARIHGTRIPVWGLVRAKQQGCTDRQIILMYPQVSRDDLLAAWEYADRHKDEIAAQIRANEEA